MHQRERSQLLPPELGGQPEWPAQSSTHSSFSKSAPNLDKKQQSNPNGACAAAAGVGSFNVGSISLGGGIGVGGGGSTPTTPMYLGGSVAAMGSVGAGVAAGIPYYLLHTTTTNNNNKNLLLHNNNNNNCSINSSSNNNNNNNHISSNNNNNHNNNNNTHVKSSKTSPRLNGNHNNHNNNSNSSYHNNSGSSHRSNYGRARSQDYGLDHLPNQYNVTHLLSDSSETQELTPKIGCFHFLKSGTGTATGGGGATGAAAAAVADADARLGGGSLGNSPAVGRKKHSLDSQYVVAVQVTSPSPTAQVGGGGNNTYDRAFYRDLTKKLFASSERVNSKSSGDLTMYNSASRLTEARAVGEYDYDGYHHEDDDDDDDADVDGRFQRNASGSQFPRHCFFRQQQKQQQQEEHDEDEDEERQINSHCSSEHSSSTADNSGTSRTGVVPRKSSVTFQISARGAGGSNVEMPLSPQQTSIASISFATTNYSSSEEAAADDDIDEDRCQQQQRSDNDHDSGHRRLQGNSILYTRRMLDVQPHPDVIKMNEKFAELMQQEQQQLQLQQKLRQQQQQQHSSSGIGFKTLMSLFTRNSKKKYTKLFDNQLGNSGGGTLEAVCSRGIGSIAGFSAIDPYEASGGKAYGNGTSQGGRGNKRKCKKQQTQSCEQLERV